MEVIEESKMSNNGMTNKEGEKQERESEKL